ncbi:protein FAM32A-like [Canis lupus familiaris]|uniref:protein FAM32A-like n=1 Tax=Canis lupus familiaris TaxID=9615 RepID=UPI00023AE352|nr:protein FAM32A-like [Canis lupus familiaris]
MKARRHSALGPAVTAAVERVPSTQHLAGCSPVAGIRQVSAHLGERQVDASRPGPEPVLSWVLALLRSFPSARDVGSREIRQRTSGSLTGSRGNRWKASGLTVAYEQVQKGPLKLKGVAEFSVTNQKKKQKDKDKAKLLEVMGMSKKNEKEKWRGLDKRTPAQASFEKSQEKWQMERILKKAPKIHKQRVEDFNRPLDTLTEHYDIPKVSWTK